SMAPPAAAAGEPPTEELTSVDMEPPSTTLPDQMSPVRMAAQAAFAPAETSPATGFPQQGVPPEWARPMVQPELGWYEGRPSPRPPKNPEWSTAAACESLRDNALDEAIDHAEHAIVTCRAAGEVLGQMRLVQAISLRWLGHYADAERCAVEATDVLSHGSPG